MVDANGTEIHVGDIVIYARAPKSKGIEWSRHEVLGFTTAMVKIPTRGEVRYYGDETYRLICPNNCVVVEKGENCK